MYITHKSCGVPTDVDKCITKFKKDEIGNCAVVGMKHLHYSTEN